MSQNKEEEGRRSNKRPESEHNSSYEEDQKIFGRSRKLDRSPVKSAHNQEQSTEMEEVKDIRRTISNDIREMKQEMVRANQEMKKM